MKILLISHNCFSTYQNMGKTFLSLFSNFEKSEICQLYIYPTIPDVDVCSSYYRVTDKDILNSLLKFRKPGGEIDKSKISSAEKNLFENAEDAQLYRKKGNKEPLKRLLRDFMWKLSRYYTKELEAWLDREAPTAIFLSPGYAKFIYDIALKISKKRNIPIVTYICDDYYFVNTPKSLLGKLQLKSLQKKTDKLMKKTSHLITICDDIKNMYETKFGVASTVIMTGTSYEIAECSRANKNPTSISYFGNIGCNRYVSLADIGKELDKINSEKGTSYLLKIYTGEKNLDILGIFNEIKSTELCGFISGREFDNTLHASDILLHTEAFDETSIDLVKHSVSTKIADSLASGVPLFAYGPVEVASMKHLIKNNAAVIASSREDLRERLIEAFGNEDTRRLCAEKGILVAKEYHDSSKNSQKLKGIFDRL